MRFPGRRGSAKTVDFHVFPLTFSEAVRLKGRFKSREIDEQWDAEANFNETILPGLYEEFQQYLAHGGFLPAINDFVRDGRIRQATFSTYSDWIRGDVLKRGKQEHYLGEILEAITKRYGSQITWNALAKDLSIDHPKTVSDYVDLLVSMDAAFIQPALVEDKLVAAPKKARKVMFADPFILHATRAWLSPAEDPYGRQVLSLLADPAWTARLVEATVITQYRQYYPTFYIKAEGEVDLAYVVGNRFRPVEGKWTGQIRPKDLKQIAKYPNGLILTKSNGPGKILGIPTEPLPLALLRLGKKKRM
jgi:predicted AAA+ superfamily ATPase